MKRLDVTLGAPEREPTIPDTRGTANDGLIILAAMQAPANANDRSTVKAGSHGKARSALHSDVRITPGELLILHSGDRPRVLLSSGAAVRIDLTLSSGTALPCQHARPEPALRAGFSGPAVTYQIELDEATATDFSRALRIPSGTARNIADAHQVLVRLAEEANAMDRYSSCAISVAVIELVVLLARDAGGSGVRSDVMESVETFLLDHTDRRVGLSEMAQLAGLNASYLSRRYKELYGESPVAHHTRLRLERAAELLDAGLTTSAVASRCGFQTVYHFSNRFQRFFGVRPSAYYASRNVAHPKTHPKQT